VEASVLALMSIVMLGDVLDNWHCMTIGKRVGNDVNQNSMNVCGNRCWL